MSNQRTTQLRRLLAGEVASGDLIPIIDVSALESGPTGETKGIIAQDLKTWVVNNANLSVPFQAGQTSNGMWFDESVIPNGDRNKYCFAPFTTLNQDFSLYVRGFIPSDAITAGNDRVIFGVGPNMDDVAQILAGNCAYIAINGNNLEGYVDNGLVSVRVTATDFFTVTNPDKVFSALLTKNSAGTLSLYVNGTMYGTASLGPTTIINSSYLVMGCGRVDAARNISCTVYEAQVFSATLNDTDAEQLFYGGANVNHPAAVAAYTPENLNPGPTQWLDSVNSYHFLLPTIGAYSTNPTKTFNLSFAVTASGYLGDGTERDILPNKYILTSCVVESDFKPLVCVGTSSSLAPVSASGTGSWQDNRVPYTSASYGVNPLGIISLGVAHPDKTIYVNFSGSAYPCTFSFEGYVRN